MHLFIFSLVFEMIAKLTTNIQKIFQIAKKSLFVAILRLKLKKNLFKI